MTCGDTSNSINKNDIFFTLVNLVLPFFTFFFFLRKLNVGFLSLFLVDNDSMWD